MIGRSIGWIRQLMVYSDFSLIGSVIVIEAGLSSKKRWVHHV